MQYIDTHTHLYDEMFSGESDAAIERALEAGVAKLVFPDTDSKTRDGMLALASRHKGAAYCCIGLHPTEVSGNWQEEIDAVRRFPDWQGIVAVGEIGMDLHWTTDWTDIQEEVFRAQIDLALEKGLPIVIHNREATELILNVLKDYRGRGVRGVFHAYSGSYETFREIEKCGDFYIGIGGVVTFPKASIAQTVKLLPIERILTETDSPYLTPVPLRGKRNESSYIPLIAQKIADQKGIDIEKVVETVWDNAHEIFSLN